MPRFSGRLARPWGDMLRPLLWPPLLTKNLMSLFRHNPPTRDDEVIRLFHNRKPSWILLSIACGRCLMPTRSSPSMACPLRQVALRSAPAAAPKEEGLPYSILRCNANSRGRARALLEEIFFRRSKLHRRCKRRGTG